MINRLTTHWNFPRAIRLVLGLLVVVQAMLLHEYVLALLGGTIALLALFNVNTCGATGCAPSHTGSQKTTQTTKRIDYEKLDATA